MADNWHVANRSPEIMPRHWAFQVANGSTCDRCDRLGVMGTCNRSPKISSNIGCFRLKKIIGDRLYRFLQYYRRKKIVSIGRVCKNRYNRSHFTGKSAERAYNGANFRVTDCGADFSIGHPVFHNCGKVWGGHE